ncbi:MAG: aldo/keto reductase [Anaerolineales bacterium]|nr:aldo/keto reductase [Anaerolineales bacterium]
MTTTPNRVLGRSGIEVSPMGLGCWAIGGNWTLGGGQAGWTGVDDAESVRAIHAAIDLGVIFFDTAANYGAGHSERILGQAIQGRRGKVVIASKFGYKVDEAARAVTNYTQPEEDSDAAPHIRADLERTLQRLGTDFLDVYLLHIWGHSIERALEAREVLEKLVEEGKIRTYGWSTDRTDAIRAFSTSPRCGVIEQQFSVLDGNNELLELCGEWNLGSMIRGPLGMGLLTGKFSPASTFAEEDVRKHASWHPGFQNGRPTRDWLEKLDSIRAVLTAGGRTLAQGALAWLWARSPKAIPIPGFKNVKQVEENCGAIQFGPLARAQMDEIDRILKRG